MDDAGEAGRAGTIAARVLAQGIGFVTGVTTREAARALQRGLHGKPVVVLSSGACADGFFSAAPAQDAVHANAGAIATLRRYRKVALVAQRAEVQEAFRREFTGELALVKAQGRDAAIREIRGSPPDAVYLALVPERMLAFLRAYEDAGLFHRIPLIAAGIEPPLLERLGDFSGLTVSARWTPGMKTERSQKFVEAFRRRYDRVPTSHAVQGYDAALALGAALRAAGSASPKAVAKALREHPVEGVAGPDWHAWEVFNDSSGAPYLVARQRTLPARPGCSGR